MRIWAKWINFFVSNWTADNLEEVNVPIMKNCKSSVDIDGNEICAGDKDGGHDACQGIWIPALVSLQFWVYF